MIIKYISYFVLSVSLTLFVTPIFIKLALRAKLLDAPNDRKVHKYSKPRVGGMAMFGVYLFLLLTLDLHSQQVVSIILGSILIAFFGFLDDLFGIRALTKLFFQIFLAFITASQWLGFGLQIHHLYLFDGWSFSLGWFALPFTMLWIIGIMNALNLIDGLDGLAGGIAAIAAFTLGVTTYFLGPGETTLMLIILLGVILGFLRYNFNPAKVFMGDAGSLFLGYNLAVLSVIGVWNGEKVFAFIIPVLVLGVPIYDVLTSILRRWRRGQPVFAPDGKHIHHRIMELGFTHRQTVLVLYIETFFLALASISTLLIKSNGIYIYVAAMALLIHFSSAYIKKQYKA